MQNDNGNSNTTRVVIAILGVFLCLCVVGVICLGGLVYFSFTTAESEGGGFFATVEAGGFGDTPAPPTVPVVVVRTPAPASADDTAAAVLAADVPSRDLRELAMRLKKLGDLPVIVRETPIEYNVGDEREFWVSNQSTLEHFKITAVLRYKTDHAYMWVEKGVRLNEQNLKDAADLFEEKTYTVDREFFGSEWSPGVDGDVHLNLLHARRLGDNVAGLFSSADEFSSQVNKYSNECEIFYLNVDNLCDNCFTPINSDFYNGVLAHEFQHMIHWHNDSNEDTWMNEGSSELASFLNGYDVGGFDLEYLDIPDTQLNAWEDESAGGSNTKHYGASFLFMTYFLDRYGEEATRKLIANKENGVAAVNDVLKELGKTETFDDVYADWIVANYLDDPNLVDGEFGYNNYDPQQPKIEDSYEAMRLNAGVGPVQADVHQYGTDYIRLRGKNPVTFSFQGSTTVKLIDTNAHSGEFMWWSNRADDSDTTLTRPVDLNGVSDATLKFWTWYDLEEDWDYAYVEVSTDAGKTWDIITMPSSTDSDPNGNSFGQAYTGRSGGGNSAKWIEESVSLSAYANQKVLVRFEMITDDAVNRPGLVLDDIRIEGTNFSDDVEAGTNDWEAAGFVRHNNVLPQHFIVQVIEKTAGNKQTVRRMELNASQTGSFTLDFGGDITEAVVTISGLAPKTTELAGYEYTIAQK